MQRKRCQPRRRPDFFTIGRFIWRRLRHKAIIVGDDARTKSVNARFATTIQNTTPVAAPWGPNHCGRVLTGLWWLHLVGEFNDATVAMGGDVVGLPGGSGAVQRGAEDQ